MSSADDVTGMTYLLSQQRCVRVSYVTLPQQLFVLAPALLVPITLPVNTRDLLDHDALSFAYLRLGSILTYLLTKINRIISTTLVHCPKPCYVTAKWSDTKHCRLLVSKIEGVQMEQAGAMS